MRLRCFPRVRAATLLPSRAFALSSLALPPCLHGRPRRWRTRGVPLVALALSLFSFPVDFFFAFGCFLLLFCLFGPQPMSSLGSRQLAGLPAQSLPSGVPFWACKVLPLT